MFPNPFDDRPEALKAKVAAIYAFLALANGAAWVWAFVAFFNWPTLQSTALLAYALGLRHAFDADHIAAIDNVVRRLMQDGRQPASAGFFFSLGHSTVVVLASAAIAATAAVLKDQPDAFRDTGGIIGTAVSALFLLLIGVANLAVLRGIWAAFTRVRHEGLMPGEEPQGLLARGGLLSRVFGRLFGAITGSWQMYPIGCLFGLGFDTATEVGLLGVAAIQAAHGMSVWGIMVFPALFTAGMSLMDTTDSVVMTRTYGWAFVNPLRKLWYNLTITAASVVIALLVGGIEALGLVADKLHLHGAFWNAIGGLNENCEYVGYAIVGIFIAAWIVSTTVHRLPGGETPPVPAP